ncbi:MAG: hypothetical protein AMXMBFR64_08250 [Myxococcales bacterium]
MSVRTAASVAAALSWCMAAGPRPVVATAGPCVVGLPLNAGCGSVAPAGCCAGGNVLWCAPDGVTLCALECVGAGTCGFAVTHEIYDCGTAGLADPTGTLPMQCDWACAPDCTGRQCGPDGCLGSCGDCPQDTPLCASGGQCVSCLPDCDGKTCGLDGCGGLCGVCPVGLDCDPNGHCCTPDCTGAECGSDGCGGTCGACGWPMHCSPGRTCEECGCSGRVCGNDGCGASCGTCPAGQGCTPDGTCAPAPAGCSPGELGCSGCACGTCVCAGDPWCCSVAWDSLCAVACARCEGCGDLCVPDCQGRVCGDTDGCGGSCGTCPQGMRCAGFGKKCLPCGCTAKECGDDGCGTSCGSCPPGEVCAKGSCVPLGCGVTASPGCAGCACEECVCSIDPACCTVAWDATCATACRYECQGCPCIPDCDSRECGWVGCGYKKFTCGSCPAGAVCTLDGLCCKPSCKGKECGSDGCGGLCGECSTGQVCHAGKCTCVPVCEGKACGPDGCGGSCGDCPGSTACRGGSCEPDYPAACLGSKVPSADACPVGLGFEGCCDDQGRVVWCEGGALHCLACASKDGCGWRTQKPSGEAAAWYDCGGSGADPAGTFALLCGALCVPACTGHECGPDGCGGTCGSGCGPDVPCVDGHCSPVSPDAVGGDGGAEDTWLSDGSVGDGGSLDDGGSLHDGGAEDVASDVAPAPDEGSTDEASPDDGTTRPRDAVEARGGDGGAASDSWTRLTGDGSGGGRGTHDSAGGRIGADALPDDALARGRPEPRPGVDARTSDAAEATPDTGSTCGESRGGCRDGVLGGGAGPGPGEGCGGCAASGGAPGGAQAGALVAFVALLTWSHRLGSRSAPQTRQTWRLRPRVRLYAPTWPSTRA